MKLPESLKLLTDTLWWIQDPENLAFVLEDIFTPSEIEEVADRITILKLLKNGMSQREISEKMNVSVTTVSRWNRVLQYTAKSINNYL